MHPKGRQNALRKARASIPRQIYNVTTATVARASFFLDFQAGCAAARCFENGRLTGDAAMLAWVLMPDHVHWLVQLGGHDKLQSVVNRLKSSSAREANRKLGRTGALWQRAFHDHALRSEEDVVAVARYIISNPIRAGLVAHIGDYPFWNAVWL
jgi:putative transposase